MIVQKLNGTEAEITKTRKTSLQLPVLITYHHFSSNALTLDSNSQPLVVFALSL